MNQVEDAYALYVVFNFVSFVTEKKIMQLKMPCFLRLQLVYVYYIERFHKSIVIFLGYCSDIIVLFEVQFF